MGCLFVMVFVWLFIALRFGFWYYCDVWLGVADCFVIVLVCLILIGTGIWLFYDSDGGCCVD